MADEVHRTITISDVAEHAGVSPATVSRVLNGAPTVSPELAERVRAVIAELQYRPNGPARALRQQHTRVWAAIVADVENPFFTAVVRAIEDVAVEVDHRVVLCNSDEDVAKEAAYIDVAIAERVSGVILAQASTDSTGIDKLLAHDIPVVAIDRRPDRDDIDSVVVDNERGADLATRHLIDAGATRVACVTGPSGLSTSEERLAGYRRALSAVGRDIDPSLVRHADFRTHGGYAAAATMLTRLNRPDAFFVANNLMTLGTLQAIRDAGLRVPDDVLLIGFDDAPWTMMTDPPLSVVVQPTQAIGATAARLLRSARGDRPPEHVVLEPTLNPRQSSQR